MKLRVVLCCLILGLAAAAQTTTPNLGFTLPAIGSFNWGGPLNTDFTILDNMAGGTVPVPAMNVISLHLGSADLAVNNATSGKLQSSTLEGVIPAALIPPPSATTLGGVNSGTCPGSAINAISTGGALSCAASSTGGNGGIFNQTVTSLAPGTGSYQTIYTYNVAAGLLSSSGGIEVFCGYVTTGATSTVRLVFGSQVLGVTGIPITRIGPITLKAHIYNQGATNSQWYTMDLFAGNVTDSATTVWSYSGNNLSVDTTSIQPVVCQIQQSAMGSNAGAGFYVNRAQQ